MNHYQIIINFLHKMKDPMEIEKAMKEFRKVSLEESKK